MAFLPHLRETTLRAEVTARLKPVCAEWPLPMFRELVDQIVSITLKYDRHELRGTYEGFVADHVIDDLKAAVNRSETFRETPPVVPAVPDAERRQLPNT